MTTDRAIAEALKEAMARDAAAGYPNNELAAILHRASEIDAANPDPAAEADAVELKAWRELFAAFASQGLAAIGADVPKLWPNDWPQDVAMIAYALHRPSTAPVAEDVALRANAARYEWLRERMRRHGMFLNVGITWPNTAPESFDAAIDAASGRGRG